MKTRLSTLLMMEKLGFPLSKKPTHKYFWSPDMAQQSALEQFAIEAYEETSFSNDVSKLFSQRYWPMLIYNQFKRGFPMYEELKDNSVFHGTGYTADANFVMYTSKEGILSYAIPFMDPFSKSRKRVKGEVHLIRPETIIKLDGSDYMQNGLFFERVMVKVMLHYRLLSDNGIIRNEPYKLPLNCWMYIAKRKEWGERIENKGLYKRSEVVYNDLFDYYHFPVAEISPDNTDKKKPLIL